MFRYLLICLLLTLAACERSEIASDLSQNQANKIVSVLHEAGISAKAARESGSRGKLSVRVDSDDYSASVTVLDRKGLPATEEPSFAESIRGGGLLPSSRDVESLRLDHAAASEISSLLESHPLIRSAKAVLRQRYLPEGSRSASVSVVIELEKSAAVEVSEVKTLVEQVVPGIAPDKVFVLSSHADTSNLDFDLANSNTSLVTFLYFWQVPLSTYNSLAISLLFGLILCLGLGFIVGYWYGVVHLSKRGYEGDRISHLLPGGSRSGDLLRSKEVDS